MGRDATVPESGAAIRLERVGKRYADGTVAVHELDLDVPAGSLAVLVGPSGCGKTRSMKMINRLVEPASGRVLVDGEDVTKGDPVKLRRRIGYVIQQIGLFPHLSVAANVATVPTLLGWDKRRTRDRVDELLSLAGLGSSVRPGGTGLPMITVSAGRCAVGSRGTGRAAVARRHRGPRR